MLQIKIFIFFKKQLIEDFIQTTFPPGACEMESLNEELKRIIIYKGYYSENDYPFTITPILSTLGSIVQIQHHKGQKLVLYLMILLAIF